MKVQFFQVALVAMVGLFSEQAEAVRIHAVELPEEFAEVNIEIDSNVDLTSDDSHCAMASAIKQLLEQTNTLQCALKNKMENPPCKKQQSLLDTGFNLNLCNMNINSDLFEGKKEEPKCCPKPACCP